MSQSLYFKEPESLYEEVHRYIAVPSVAGHPTGGAIDVLLVDLNKKLFLDFGSKIYDFSEKKCYIFNPRITSTGKKNRLLLREIMLRNKFAPFDGEWWHFSYGDKEWAFYYKKNNAIYNQVELRNIVLV
jgi:D-alanyl-D-alanine dipeptidase